MIAPLLFAASLASAQGAASITQLKATFVESIDDKVKLKALQTLAGTAPTSAADVEALYDLFMRFPIDAARQAAVSSLSLLKPGVQDVEPLLLRAINDEDPASALFGMKGAEALRLKSAVPFVRKLAERKFKYEAMEKAPTVAERNAWSVEFEALAALAQLEGPKALPLLEKRAKEAPQVARLMGQYLWADSLPVVIRWNAGDVGDKERAIEALDAPVSAEALRASRQEMLRLVADPKADEELRHKLAVKVGLCSTHDEVTALLKDYDAATDAYAKELYAAAAFASRDVQVIPLLVKFAKEDPRPTVRAGARVELKELMTPADYRAVLEWAAKSDPDAENRDLAQRELKVLTY